MKYAFRIFKKCENILTRLGRPVQGHSARPIPLFSLFLLCHLSADSVYKLLNVSQQTSDVRYKDIL